MATEIKEKRTSVKLKVSTIKMVRSHGECGEFLDTVIRRLAFQKANGKETKSPSYVKRELI